jgi:hypothetical protein
MRKYLLAATTIAALAVPAIAASPAAASPRLNWSQAHRMAGQYAMNNWDPYSLLPSTSMADSWDDISSNWCNRWTATRFDCVVGVETQNYYYDPLANMNTGYAGCTGTLKVTMNRWRQVSIRLIDGPVTCSATDDTSNSSY